MILHRLASETSHRPVLRKDLPASNIGGEPCLALAALAVSVSSSCCLRHTAAVNNQPEAARALLEACGGRHLAGSR